VKCCTDLWLDIIALSSPSDHEGAAWDCGEVVKFRLRTAFCGGEMAIWDHSLSFVTCKGGSLVDPRLSCDMCEKALSLRLMGGIAELLRLGNAMTTVLSLLTGGNVTFSKSPFFSSGLGWKSSL